MLSIKTEMELLLNILPSIDDDNQYALIASRIINLNENLKRESNLSAAKVGVTAPKDPVRIPKLGRTKSSFATHSLTH